MTSSTAASPIQTDDDDLLLASLSTLIVSNPHTCTICVDTCDPSMRAIIPACDHTFCLSCLLSWASVRAVCPNCKSPFSNLLVHRDLTGAIAPGPATATGEPPWILESLPLLRRATWVHLREVMPPLHDAQSLFTLPSYRTEPHVTASSAPHYLNEEVEDELENQFWEEEEMQYRQLSGRVMSNRRYGSNGYISAGRMRATARVPGKNSHAGAASSSAQTRKNSGQQTASTGRKKKLKKKSRAGIAAAKAAAASAEQAEDKTTAGAGSSDMAETS